jgi:NDP-sugar pyrophosphorylase family protein
VISRHAIAGLYYFRRGSDFIEAAKHVLLNNNPVHDAFFISQALNEMILAAKNVGHHQIEADRYYPLYSPQKIMEFEEALLSNRIDYRPAMQKPTLVIPMAGEGSRFVKAGYKLPKPFIDVCGKPMIWRVLENLDYTAFDVVLLARKEHLESQPEGAATLMNEQGFRIVEVDRLTEGSVCTILLARREINRNAPLLIANCDQIVDFNCGKFVKDCLDRKLDGSILVFKEPGRNTKWSYARVDDKGLVTEVREKVAISELATVGIYFFAKAAYFIDAAIDMIARNDRVNNEFYTCPVYNYMIAQGQRVGIYEIPQNAMHGIGTPEDLDAYIRLRNGEQRVGNLSSR